MGVRVSLKCSLLTQKDTKIIKTLEDYTFTKCWTCSLQFGCRPYLMSENTIYMFGRLIVDFILVLDSTKITYRYIW